MGDINYLARDFIGNVSRATAEALAAAAPGSYPVGNIYDAQLIPKLALGLAQAVSDAGIGGGGTWGSITGAIESQTDLSAALASKQDTITFGTGVLTALGNALDATSGLVGFNGRLGTPLSGTLTNCTGLPIAGLTGLGTGVAAALANAVNGSGGLLTYAIIGTSGATLGLLNTANTWSAAQINSTNGASSTPAIKLSGSWFTGGSATTTKPQLLIEPSGATSTGWSTNGTGIGVNAASGFTGYLIDLQTNGSSKVSIDNSGTMILANGFTTRNCYLGYFAAGSLALNIDASYIQMGASATARIAWHSANALEINNGTTGTYGTLYTKLPTTNPGPGVLWNNAGTPAIGT